jgi:hypothetical protein
MFEDIFGKGAKLEEMTDIGRNELFQLGLRRRKEYLGFLS